MDTATAAILIAGATLLLNVGLHIYGGSWNLATKLAEMERSLRTSIGAAKDEVEERQDTATRQFGETIAALRQKLNEVELDMARNYMRRDSFYPARQEMSDQIKELGRTLNARLDRLETKIDGRA